MKYLFDCWKEIEKKISQKKVFLLLDYDGTLAPIVKNPEKVKHSKEMGVLLKEISRKLPFAIISGRSLEKIKELVGIENVFYAGNHGLEVEGIQKKFIHPTALRIAPSLRKIYKDLKKIRIKGIFVEDKKLTISFHYRAVPKGKIALAKKKFEKIVKPRLKKGLRIEEGRKRLDVKPDVDWNKGKAVKLILKIYDRKKILPICLGDDKTDEDAFLALKRGITIWIKSREIKVRGAKYYLKNISEVKEFLNQLNKIIE